jgi:ATP-dependent DNA helicase RecG
MRPSPLDPFFAPVASLPGIGPKLAQAFDRLLGEEGRPARVVDLLLHAPHAAIDRQASASIADAPIGGTATFRARVAEHRPTPPGSRAPYRVIVEDESGDVTLLWFKADPRRIKSMLPVGETRIISGKVELWDGVRQMVHPERVLDEAGFARLPAFEPVYGLVEGLSPRLVARAVEGALARLPSLPEWIDAPLIARQHWPAFADALRALHTPGGIEPDLQAPARRRLAYDELLASQIALALVRRDHKAMPGRINAGDGDIGARILAALPFRLTPGQNQAVAEIRADMGRPERMLRLLQGDVGSGKTIVALLAMAAAAEAGRQSVLMAPTDILARQHFARIAPLAEAAGLHCVLVTGRDRPSERARALEALSTGAAHIAIGTHALFEGAVAFADLGLAVIDEQHRFGVHQRLKLGAKGAGVDMLVMTATPIPRTLALAYFGDMDVSVLAEKPAGRRLVSTRLISMDRHDEVVNALSRAIGAGAQVYWVCPLVQESETLDIATAQERFEELRGHFGARVGLLHGQMKGAEKDAAMADFVAGRTRILVSTTVIEVGVDVPNASVMVIEHAERFGLSQLHQLRGRIGRGGAASTCLLLYKGPLGPVAERRLAVMRETEDGFRIAEEDMRLRGPGEILGTKQSGQPDFRIARPDADADLIPLARDDARLLVETDPELLGNRGAAARLLLYLFERDAAVRLLRAG